MIILVILGIFGLILYFWNENNNKNLELKRRQQEESLKSDSESNNSTENKKLPSMPYETDEYKKIFAQKQISQTKKIIPNQNFNNQSKNFGLYEITEKKYNHNLKSKNLLVPVPIFSQNFECAKSTECLYCVYDLKNSKIPKKFFKNDNFYKYNPEENDIIRKFPIVGRNLNLIIYLNIYSDESYELFNFKNTCLENEYLAIVYLFDSLKDKLNSDGSINSINVVKFIFYSSDKKTYLKGVSDFKSNDLTKKFLSLDNGFLINLSNQIKFCDFYTEEELYYEFLRDAKIILENHDKFFPKRNKQHQEYKYYEKNIDKIFDPNPHINNEEFIIPIKNNECIYLVYEKNGVLKKIFFSNKRYQYNLDKNYTVIKCPIVGGNLHWKYYLDLSSYITVDSKNIFCGTVYSFDSKKIKFLMTAQSVVCMMLILYFHIPNIMNTI